MSDNVPAISWISPLVMRKECLVEEGSIEENPMVSVYRQELIPLPVFRREVAELKEVQELCFDLNHSEIMFLRRHDNGDSKDISDKSDR